MKLIVGDRGENMKQCNCDKAKELLIEVLMDLTPTADGMDVRVEMYVVYEKIQAALMILNGGLDEKNK